MEERWQTLKTWAGCPLSLSCVSLFVFSGGIIGYLSDLSIETFVTNSATQRQYPSSQHNCYGLQLGTDQNANVNQCKP